MKFHSSVAASAYREISGATAAKEIKGEILRSYHQRNINSALANKVLKRVSINETRKSCVCHRKLNKSKYQSRIYGISSCQ
jgi:hypothetical protein